MHRILSIASLAMLVLCSSCQTRERPVGPVSVRTREAPPSALVAVSDLTRGDEKVGIMRTFAFEDESGAQFKRVYDAYDRYVGYISHDGQAFQITAHGGEDLVSTGSDDRRNAAAILGMPGAQIQVNLDPRLR